jgi:hypothetical protein
MTTIIPYIRSSVIEFTAKGLKPFTQVYPFFDNQDVSEYCKMTTDVDYDSPLVTDVNGELSGHFRIPGGVFLTGTKTFILTNDANGVVTDGDSNAIITFVTNKSGIYESSNIISTQNPNITIGRFNTVQDPITARQTFGISYKDPLAQTFVIQNNPHGVALTKVDVYFKTRPESASVSASAADNAPITLEIREVVDGFPSDNIVPYSTVTLFPKDVNPSDDGTAPTVFLFPSPVYLKNNTEYAMVLIPAGDNTDYEVWVGRLGSPEVGGTVIVDRQPNVGTLFIANNDSGWVSYADRDIKFTLYIAEFDYTLTGEVELKNKKVDYITVPSSETLLPGDVLVRKTTADVTTAQGTVLYFNNITSLAEVLVTSGDFDLTSTSDVVVVLSSPISGTITCTTGSTTVTGSGTSFTTELSAGNVLVNSSGTTIGTISSITNNTTLVLSANAAVAVTAGRTYIKNTTTITLNENVVHVISPGLSYLNFKTTDVDWEYKLYDTTGVDTSYVALPEISAVTLGERKLYSYSDEQSTLVPALDPDEEGTLMVKATMSATTDNISPMIDVEKTNVVLMENYTDALTDELTGLATTSTSSTTVTGSSGTLYLTEIVPGAVLRNDDDAVIGVVRGVVSNTSLELYDTATETITTETIKADNIASSEVATRVGQYITKTVDLANNQDADDIVVYLNADIPPNTDVRVYVKLLSATDTEGMNGRVWTLLEKSRASSTVTFANWQYKLRKNAIDNLTAVGGLNGSNVFAYTSLDGASTYSTFKTFAIKIAMTTSNPAVVPSVFNMGVVALQAE